MSLAAGSTIGIIGGGQLGRMLAMAAARLGYRTVVLEPQPDCPAAQVANRQITAAYDDTAALAELAAVSAVVTYEFENVPVMAASALAVTVPVYPPARALEVAQDRVVEKKFLNGIGIPTADFCPVDNDDELTAALKKFDGSGILKTRRMGYDGKGQRVFRNMETGGFAGTCEAMGNVPLILESFVAFEREISVIAARGMDGSLAAYDPAENIHRSGILHSSTLPARIGSETAAAAQAAAAEILAALDYVGVIGIEFFVLADGALLANEIAPRVHNSGHWTEAACLVSQFEQHIRAVAGLPLGNPGRHFDCVMENLIGDDILRVPALLAEPDLMLHLYGKAEARPGRKMGHFTRMSRHR
ncbi:MAG: 5-(carboxyamino)imidazole ribonucleotide synthase [Mesorhizobium sp.]|jgi:5-(carboxyamino)imidazole ribonucleotide synthase|uniref:5-(carboxyamino)imidazole ribonucleotide synthase n=1 Tax=Mesorhizobium TaxID=68287 RepID=UPI0004805A07|nr:MULTISPECIES: 5-(carboxyamino)imidazole ribonucleotide synthase [Mesorhizobium]MCF6115779.1 5-(carboxyamino)imidazole ribonucleotide synthase [Mesorhizobium muleiense]RWO12256.1 MAG: 5-(carboxyamino)imidazole ribonucleotide synthase [Mesorhizobium sp.]RWP27683.1 MAG: 5-(carboxyamino)imidazole ribonucleotide synthase [Mesorhizobium sp.]RWQ59964.1 MAG: 5-(carboxyamino)imidazole ribonucleotide synthase [Mesorhizobium sp.]TIL42304.1 MAG: 5-(carboxyamino)imidazole ribonucleotide synthase [Mesorh